MDLSWYKGLIFGLVSGITEILPVSSQAHRILMLELFGISSEPPMLQLMIDLGIAAALYYSCQNHIVRIIRAKRLSRVPKRRRKRPLDTTSLMDFSLIKTMIVPVILSFFLYNRARTLGNSMLLIAIFMLFNGIILYIPQYFPGGNRDSRTMSRVHGLLMGLGGAAGIIPGISGTGCALSIGSLCTVDKTYGLNMVLLMELFVFLGRIVLDIVSMISYDQDLASVGMLIVYLLSGVASFLGTTSAVKLLKNLIGEISISVFGFYCWGVALFTFVMNLLA